MRLPTLLEALRDKKVCHVAVGALHCLAVTASGQVGFYDLNKHLYGQLIGGCNILTYIALSTVVKYIWNPLIDSHYSYDYANKPTDLMNS